MKSKLLSLTLLSSLCCVATAQGAEDSGTPSTPKSRITTKHTGSPVDRFRSPKPKTTPIEEDLFGGADFFASFAASTVPAPVVPVTPVEGQGNPLAASTDGTKDAAITPAPTTTTPQVLPVRSLTPANETPATIVTFNWDEGDQEAVLDDIVASPKQDAKKNKKKKKTTSSLLAEQPTSASVQTVPGHIPLDSSSGDLNLSDLLGGTASPQQPLSPKDSAVDVDAADLELETLKAKLQELRKNLLQPADLNSQLLALQQQVVELKESNAQSLTAREHLEELLEEKEETITQHENDIDQQTRLIEGFKLKFNENKAEIAAFKEKVEKAEQSIEEKKKEIGFLKEILESANGQAEDDRTEIDRLTRELKEATSQIKQGVAATEGLRKQLDEANLKVEAGAKKIKELAEEIQQREEGYENLLAQKQEIAENLRKAEEAKADLQGKLDGATAASEQTEQDLTKAQKEHREVAEMLAKAEQQLKTYAEELRQQAEANAKLDAEVIAAKAQVTAGQRQYQALKEDHERSGATVEAQKKELLGQQKELGELRGKVSALEHDLDELDQQTRVAIQQADSQTEGTLGEVDATRKSFIAALTQLALQQKGAPKSADKLKSGQVAALTANLKIGQLYALPAFQQYLQMDVWKISEKHQQQGDAGDSDEK